MIPGCRAAEPHSSFEEEPIGRLEAAVMTPPGLFGGLGGGGALALAGLGLTLAGRVAVSILVLVLHLDVFRLLLCVRDALGLVVLGLLPGHAHPEESPAEDLAENLGFGLGVLKKKKNCICYSPFAVFLRYIISSLNGKYFCR